MHTFSEAECAIYLADTDGHYRRTEGQLAGVAEHLDADDPFLVTLRAERAAGTSQAKGIALALPMIHRTEVIGVVLLGRKPSGFDYRPDETELLAYAAHQIGLDLHALKVEQLEAANDALTTANGLITAKYEDLKALTSTRLGTA